MLFRSMLATMISVLGQLPLALCIGLAIVLTIGCYSIHAMIGTLTKEQIALKTGDK